jgi:hypothetical protein
MDQRGAHAQRGDAWGSSPEGHVGPSSGRGGHHRRAGHGDGDARRGGVPWADRGVEGGTSSSPVPVSPSSPSLTLASYLGVQECDVAAVQIAAKIQDNNSMPAHVSESLPNKHRKGRHRRSAAMMDSKGSESLQNKHREGRHRRSAAMMDSKGPARPRMLQPLDNRKTHVNLPSCLQQTTLTHTRARAGTHTHTHTHTRARARDGYAIYAFNRENATRDGSESGFRKAYCRDFPLANPPRLL